MKAIKKILGFCNEITFKDHYFIEGVLELNHLRAYTGNVSFESVFVHEDNRIRVLGVIDDISLMVKK